MKNIFWLLLAFLASFLTFCNQSQLINRYIRYICSNDPMNISIAKDIIQFLSIIISTYLGIIIVKKEFYIKKISCQDKFLMINVKNEILHKIESYGLSDIGLRLFTPKYGFLRNFLKKFFKKFIPPRKFLFIREIATFTDEHKFKDLSFRIKNPYQGIVGECYNSKSTKCVNNLSIELENANYRFDFNHKQKLAAIKFCLCIPIFNKNDVVAVFQVDSPSNCILDEEDKKRLSEDIYDFVQSFFDECPNLFIG
jgi:hypothetical protein